MDERRLRARLVAVLIVLLALVGAPARADQDGSLARTQRMVEQFNARFVKIGPGLAENLDQLYTEDVRFRDPISAVTGLVDLRRYFEHFAEAAAGSHFEIGDQIVQPGQAVIFWTMVMVKADGTEARRFAGVSHLKVRDRIYEERDYFDLGDAVYDHVPVVGWLTRFVRSRLD
jgi:limonene-1,2-epoxide hydrolase